MPSAEAVSRTEPYRSVRAGAPSLRWPLLGCVPGGRGERELVRRKHLRVVHDRVSRGRERIRCLLDLHLRSARRVLAREEYVVRWRTRPT
jgi:hypothetical protein